MRRYHDPTFGVERAALQAPNARTEDCATLPHLVRGGSSHLSCSQIVSILQYTKESVAMSFRTLCECRNDKSTQVAQSCSLVHRGKTMQCHMFSIVFRVYESESSFAISPFSWIFFVVILLFVRLSTPLFRQKLFFAISPFLV